MLPLDPLLLLDPLQLLLHQHERHLLLLLLLDGGGQLLLLNGDGLVRLLLLVHLLRCSSPCRQHAL